MKTEYQNYIIDKLRKLRINKGYSQAAVAECLNISLGQIGNIESNKTTHKYTLSQVYDLCKLFNIPIEEVFTCPNEEESPGISNIDRLILNIIKYEKR